MFKDTVHSNTKLFYEIINRVMINVIDSFIINLWSPVEFVMFT